MAFPTHVTTAETGGINRRLAPLLNGDAQAQHPATLPSSTAWPGLPCLYYGDELGMRRWPGLRDRDPNRTTMAWSRAPKTVVSTKRSRPRCWCCRRITSHRF